MLYIKMNSNPFSLRMSKRKFRKRRPKAVIPIVRRILKSYSKPQPRRFEVGQTDITMDYNGTVQLLTGVVQGDDIVNCSGNSLIAKSLYIRGYFQNEGSLATNHCVRLMVIEDKMHIGNAPTIPNLLQYTGSKIVVNSPLNVDSLKRYKVLVDKVVRINVQFAGSPQFYPFKIYKKMNLKIDYTDATTGTYKNQLYIVYMSDRVTTLLPTLTYTSRLMFHDN
uniref:Capsid protein n=1 Tax=virus sp. ctDKz4 TaxID=2825808 RepID=A0A8S5VIE9_9VIRU|nr:MAG TPA: capsid protein [virus sp. ctDKz4]